MLGSRVVGRRTAIGTAAAVGLVTLKLPEAAMAASTGGGGGEPSGSWDIGNFQVVESVYGGTYLAIVAEWEPWNTTPDASAHVKFYRSGSPDVLLADQSNQGSHIWESFDGSTQVTTPTSFPDAGAGFPNGGSIGVSVASEAFSPGVTYEAHLYVDGAYVLERTFTTLGDN